MRFGDAEGSDHKLPLSRLSLTVEPNEQITDDVSPSVLISLSSFTKEVVSTIYSISLKGQVAGVGKQLHCGSTQTFLPLCLLEMWFSAVWWVHSVNLCVFTLGLCLPRWTAPVRQHEPHQARIHYYYHSNTCLFFFAVVRVGFQQVPGTALKARVSNSRPVVQMRHAKSFFLGPRKIKKCLIAL